MRVFVVRHGHTFAPEQPGGQAEIMCGCTENLPLVERGRHKARRMAAYLQQRCLRPQAIFANFLIRTWEHACIIREDFYHRYNITVPLHEDQHFIELDYGAWAGLPTASGNNEVIRRFGVQAWEDWQLRRIIPNQAPHHWPASSEEIIARVAKFFNQCLTQFSVGDTVVVIASQGTMSFIHSLLPGGMTAAVQAQQLKTAPGNFAELVYQHQKWQLLNWNTDPEKCCFKNSEGLAKALSCRP